MALLMVHLRVADLWARRHPEYLESPEFYLGAISPDAIHVRDHDDKSRKDEIHLYNWRTFHREPVEAYWRARHAPFDIGYGVHVLTDCQWVARYRERLPQIIKPDGLVDVDIYYNDTFITDFEMYDALPRLRQIIDMIETAVVPANHPLLTQYELTEWRRLMVNAYRGECPRQGQVRYITRDYVKAFAEDSLALIEEVYGEVMQRETMRGVPQL